MLDRRCFTLTCTKDTFRPFPSEVVHWFAWERDSYLLQGFGKAKPPMSRREWERLREKGYRYCFAAENDRMVAWAGVWPRTEEVWEVIAVYTAPEFRRRGYGKAVVSLATAYILKCGRAASCGTKAGNLAMIRTAESVGFRRVPTSHN